MKNHQPKQKQNGFHLNFDLGGPNKFMWINSNGLDVMISLIDFKEDLVCFPSWHASQMRSFSNFK